MTEEQSHLSMEQNKNTQTQTYRNIVKLIFDTGAKEIQFMVSQQMMLKQLDVTCKMKEEEAVEPWQTLYNTVHKKLLIIQNASYT